MRVLTSHGSFWTSLNSLGKWNDENFIYFGKKSSWRWASNLFCLWRLSEHVSFDVLWKTDKLKVRAVMMNFFVRNSLAAPQIKSELDSTLKGDEHLGCPKAATIDEIVTKIPNTILHDSRLNEHEHADIANIYISYPLYLKGWSWHEKTLWPMGKWKLSNSLRNWIT